MKNTTSRYKTKDSAGMWLIIFLLLILSACSEDNFSHPDNPSEADDYGYISFLINIADDAPVSRGVFDSQDDNATGGNHFFNDGQKQEKAVASDPEAHWVVAYDNNQNVIATLPLLNLQETGYLGNNNIAYKGVCHLPLKSPFLSSINNMRVILNANPALQSKLKDNDDIKLIDTDKLFYEDGDDKYHTMTTAMAVVNNRLSPTSTMEMENGSLKYYKTEDEAIASPSVTLYVERLQSKFTLLFNLNGTEYYFDNNKVCNTSNSNENTVLILTPKENPTLNVVTEYNGEANVVSKRWKANITGWGVNGTESVEYLFKYLGTNPTSFLSWNYSSGGSVIRNLWTVDYNYTNTYSKYPDQYRPANDKIFSPNGDTFKSYKDNEETHTLNYFTFSELSKRHIREYQGENTYSPNLTFSGMADPLGDLAHFRCGSHLIVCAQLLTEDIDGAAYNSSETNENGLIEGVSDKYFTNNEFWTKSAYIDYFRLVIGNNMKVTTKCVSDLSSNFIPNNVFSPSEINPKFYVKRNGVYVEANSDDFDIVPAEIIGGDGWCYPYPINSEGVNTSLYVKTGYGTDDRSFKVITNDQYKQLVYGYTTYFAKHFKEGRMYYALPIMHNPGRQDEGDFGKRTADHGMVRNNWYHFNIAGVEAPGVPVDDPAQPIIPNNEPAAKGMGFETKIIPWHMVEELVDI